ncbi:MAG: hypothetical protein KIT33_11185 [Candidatus Kapabacteria bacterium]|nr:hypothetical protein [Ignavibacteriota bacterium]MCW5885521.1 hypothetical protein [Candidatus Kapabacteria bacterium]
MKKLIFVPHNFVFPEILGNIERVCEEKNFELIKTDEASCIENMLKNRASLALLSPLGYGAGVKNADFRIIPSFTAGFVGYSGRASLYFNQGLSTIEAIGSANSSDFLMKIGNILLSERYDIYLKLEQCKGDVDDILKSYSAALSYGNDETLNSMDITEDWFETFEIPLIAGTWVTRNEEEPDDVIELTNLFALDEIPEEIDINPNSEREGKILTRWNPEIKLAFEQNLELLYYHKLIPEIPAVKVFGVD